VNLQPVQTHALKPFVSPSSILYCTLIRFGGIHYFFRHIKQKTLHLIPRDGSGKPKLALTIPFDGILDADLQFINAYEQQDGTLIFDAIRLQEHGAMQGSTTPPWPWAATLESFQQHTCQRSLVRYTVSPSSSNNNNRAVSKTILFDTQCYFGGINPAKSCQPHRYIYMSVGAMGNTVAPPQGIARLDTETNQVVSWMPPADEFCGEPMYAKRSSSGSSSSGTAKTSDDEEKEDGGYILSVVTTGAGKDSVLVVLRANDIAAGPVARVPLGLAVPHGLYGCYTEDGGGFTLDEIDRRAKLADKMEGRGNMWNEVKSDFSGLGLRLDDFEEYFGDLM
jgi:all-trans-8'-apo-beta-carotenal 15,15'-oxygenase